MHLGVSDPSESIGAGLEAWIQSLEGVLPPKPGETQGDSHDQYPCYGNMGGASRALHPFLSRAAS